MNRGIVRTAGSMNSVDRIIIPGMEDPYIIIVETPLAGVSQNKINSNYE